MIDIPSKDDITIGRLKKKIDKLQKQRNFYFKKLNYYKNILDHHWMIESNYKSYQEHKKIIESNRQLEARVKEQAMLIKRLNDLITPAPLPE